MILHRWPWTVAYVAVVAVLFAVALLVERLT